MLPVNLSGYHLRPRDKDRDTGKDKLLKRPNLWLCPTLWRVGGPRISNMIFWTVNRSNFCQSTRPDQLLIIIATIIGSSSISQTFFRILHSCCLQSSGGSFFSIEVLKVMLSKSNISQDKFFLQLLLRLDTSASLALLLPDVSVFSFFTQEYLLSHSF